MDQCDCADCKSKRKVALDTIMSIESKIAQVRKKGIYPMGLPHAKLHEILEEAKKGI